MSWVWECITCCVWYLTMWYMSDIIKCDFSPLLFGCCLYMGIMHILKSRVAASGSLFLEIFSFNFFIISFGYSLICNTGEQFICFMLRFLRENVCSHILCFGVISIWRRLTSWCLLIMIWDFLWDLNWCVLIKYFYCNDTLSEGEHMMTGVACLFKLNLTWSAGSVFRDA